MIELLGDRLKSLRMNKSLTQTQVAELLNVSSASISAYETNLKNPSYAILVKLARIYHTSTDYLLGLEQKNFQLDLSGLTSDEVRAIKTLIRSLRSKH